MPGKLKPDIVLLDLGLRSQDSLQCRGPSKPASQGHDNLPPVLIVFTILAIANQRVKLLSSVFDFGSKFLPV